MTATVRHYVSGGRERGGGIGRLVGNIVDAAAEGGVEHLVTDTRGPRWSVPGSPLRLSAALATLAGDRLAAPRRIQHIHIAGRGSTARKLVLTAAARSIGAPYVLHLHDYDYARDYTRRSPRLQAAIRAMFAAAERVIVLGNRDAGTMTGLLGVPAERVEIFHNCVPDPGETPPRRPGAAPRIVFLGQLSERKGVPELLQALASPSLAALDWQAVLAGDGPVEGYRADADRLGLANRVSMPGWLGLTDTRALCADADILVLPSYSEGMAMAVIEGLAHGLAVVTTRVGAHEEAITDGRTGRFVPVGDVSALAGALARLVADPTERARLGSEGRALFLSRFSMSAYMRRLDGLYDRLVETARAIPAE
ncbi:glycosyltransferase involved in cell wall biosynthesis [Amaricoccus macauensis]|uniref:Glycosyltransferase involved in cell wall biosynthesis n=1 Tax=Amaricoccus macauensis TaxID=57001 RepID=A0A840SNG3_9RHOB|nr:glycosyltransferase family 4 protein [Amaricoccus macauensis]MBB5222135.1 glycosyltransferase involved in cell wall biosynthesis [Amaricoccus macauensis]